MRNPGGYARIFSPDRTVVNFDHIRCEEINAGVFEADTFCCFHCGRMVHVRPRMDPADLGGMCKICYHLVCPTCVGNGCDPFEEKLRRAEASEIARRSYG